MKQIVCDRCGKIIEKGDGFVKLKQRSLYIDVKDIDFHLCCKCHDKFESFLANKTQVIIEGRLCPIYFLKGATT